MTIRARTHPAMRHTKFVFHFLEDSAERFGNKPALYAAGIWHTYAELNDRANRLAHLFIGRGLKPGDRVALLIENSAEYVISYYGVQKAGGTAVPLNTENTAADIAFIAQDCGVKFLVAGYRHLARTLMSPPVDIHEPAPALGTALEAFFLWNGPIDSNKSCCGFPVVPLPEAAEACPKANPQVRIIDLDIASIVYTSGSTGKPRGVMLSHLNIVSNTHSIVDYLRLTPEDRILVVLPFHYIYGKSLLNTHVYVGGSVVLDNRFLYPNVILQTMREQRVTGFAGVPSTYTILLNRSNLKDMKFPDLRYVTQAGGAMAPSVQKEVAAAFAPARLFVMYGATEAAARLSYLDPDDLPRKWGSIGKGIANVDLYVADENGHPLPSGREGEIRRPWLQYHVGLLEPSRGNRARAQVRPLFYRRSRPRGRGGFPICGRPD